jgi:hypothetical protein
MNDLMKMVTPQAKRQVRFVAFRRLQRAGKGNIDLLTIIPGRYPAATACNSPALFFPKAPGKGREVGSTA